MEQSPEASTPLVVSGKTVNFLPINLGLLIKATSSGDGGGTSNGSFGCCKAFSAGFSMCVSGASGEGTDSTGSATS